MTIQSQSKVSTFTFDGGGLEQVFANPAGSYIGQTSSGTFVAWGSSISGGSFYNADNISISSLLNAELEAGSFVKQVEKTQGAYAVLFSSGTVITWGNYEYGGCIWDSDYNCNAKLTEVKKIYSNNSSFLAEKIDGTLQTWGDDTNGGAIESDYTFDPIDKIVQKVVSNDNAFAVLFEDGSVISWGNIENNNSGYYASAIGTYITSSGITDIHAYGFGFMAVGPDVSPTIWGQTTLNDLGRTQGDFSSLATLDGAPTETNSTETNYELFSAGYNDNWSAVAVLTSEGRVFTWGSESYGVVPDSIASTLNNSDHGQINKLKTFENPNHAAAAVLTKNNEFILWGDDYNNFPDYAGPISNVSDFFSTDGAFALLNEDGTITTLGDRFYGGASPGSTCSHTLNMEDSYGDGWNEAELDIYINEVFFTTVTFDDGSDGIVNFDVLPGDEIVLHWYNDGWNPAEISWSVTDGNNNILAQGDNPTTDDKIEFNAGSCPLPPAIEPVTKIYANDEAFVALTNSNALIPWGNTTKGGENNSGVALDNIVQVYTSPSGAAYDAFAALNTSNQVIVWGSFSGVVSPANSEVSVSQIYASDGSFSILYSDGSLKVIDESKEYTLNGNTTFNFSNIPAPEVINIATDGSTVLYDKTPDLFGTAEPWGNIRVYKNYDTTKELISITSKTQPDGRWYAKVNEMDYGVHTVTIESRFPGAVGTTTITFEVKKRPNSFEATLPNGHEIEAYKYNIRESGFKLFSWDGTNLNELENPSESTTYRGRIKNIPNSKIVLSWYPNGDWFITELYDKGGNSVTTLNYNKAEAENYQVLSLPYNDTDGGAARAKYHFDTGFSSYWDLMQKMLNGDPVRGTKEEDEWNVEYNIDDGLALFEAWINVHDITMARDLDLSLSLQSLVLPVKPTSAPIEGWNGTDGRFNALSHVKNTLGIGKTTYVEDNGSGETLENVYVHPQIPVSPMWWNHYVGGGLAGGKDWSENYKNNFVNVNKWGSGTGSHEIGHSVGLGHHNSFADAMGGGGMLWLGRDSKVRAIKYLENYPRLKVNGTYTDPVHPYANDLFGTVSPTSSISFDITAENFDTTNFDANGEAVQIKEVEKYSTRGGIVTIDSSTQFTYTPPANFSGKDTFGYTIKSGSGTSEYNASGIVHVYVYAPNSLVVHYGFNETENSVINDLTFGDRSHIGHFVGNNRETATTTGVVSNALALDGRSGVLLNDLVDPLLDSQTVSLWIKPNDTSASGVIYDTGAKASNTKSGISIDIVDGVINFYVQPSGLREEGVVISKIISSSDLNSDGWANIALVIDRNNTSSSVRAFWNGSQIEEKTISTTGVIKGKIDYGYIPSSIGFLADGSPGLDNLKDELGGGFEGVVDEFKLYNYARSSQEISDEFNTISSSTAPTQTTFDGLFDSPILNGNFEAGRPLVTFLKKDWKKFGSVAKDTRAKSAYNKNETQWSSKLVPEINTLGTSFLSLKKVNWSESSGIFQQIGYYKSDLKFQVRFKTAARKKNAYAGLKVSVYAGGSPVYSDLSLGDSKYGNFFAPYNTWNAPKLLKSWTVPSGLFSSNLDFIEQKFDFDITDLDSSILSGIDGNTPVWIQFETTTTGSNTLLDDVQVVSNETPSVEATWFGTTNNDWNNTSNWSSGAVPDSNDDVVVPSGLTNYPTASSPVTVNSVTMNSGSTLIAEAGFSGTITYNRELPTSNWYLVGSPVVGQLYNNDYVSDNGIAINNTNRAIAPYATETNTWSYMQEDDSAAFFSGIGNSVKRTAAGTVSFEGSLKEDDTSIALFTDGNGYNLLGNPHPSYLQSNAVLTNSSDALASQTIWIWNQATNNYDTYVTADDYKIAPGQGFFVKSDGQAGNLTIDSDNQQHLSSDTFQRTVSRPELHVTLSNENQPNRTAKIYYLENTTTGFDNGYDGEQFGGIANDFTIYSHLLADSEGKDYAIQSLPTDNYEQMVIPLGVNATAGTAIKINAEKRNFQEALNVYLEDRLTNTFTLLDVEHHFETMLTENLNGIGRFYMHTVNGTLNIEDAAMQDTINIYTIDTETLRVVGVQNDQAKLQLYNTMGQAVYQTSFTGKGVNDVVLPNLSAGIYLVQLVTPKGTIANKILIQ